MKDEKDFCAGLIHPVASPLDETLPRLNSHTPGPWLAFPKRKYNEWHVSLPCDDSNMRVALCPDGVPGSTEEECAANAHLIAAAPEMHEALKGLMAQFDAGYFVRNVESDGRADWAINAARSVRALAIAVQAIAKAEGR